MKNYATVDHLMMAFLNEEIVSNFNTNQSDRDFKPLDAQILNYKFIYNVRDLPKHFGTSPSHILLLWQEREDLPNKV